MRLINKPYGFWLGIILFIIGVLLKLFFSTPPIIDLLANTCSIVGLLYTILSDLYSRIERNLTEAVKTLQEQQKILGEIRDKLKV